MNLSPKRITKYRKNAKLYRLPDDKKDYPIFTPNPGGQENLFTNYLTLESTYNYFYRWILISGGINSGKSTCAAAFICSQVRLDRESRILITANTYGQLETSTLVALAEYCDRFGYSLQPSGGSVEETARKIAKNRYCRIEGAYCFVLSAENFTGRTERSKQSGRGLQIRLIWADEFTYAEKTAFEAIDGRLGRGAGKIKGIGIISSTINRNNPYLLNSNTFELADKVCSYVSGYNLKCYIYGDASGMQRTANSKQTNWAIVWDYLDKYQIKAVRRYEKANPSIIDSVNSVNCLLASEHLVVGDRCKQLIDVSS